MRNISQNAKGAAVSPPRATPAINAAASHARINRSPCPPFTAGKCDLRSGCPIIKVGKAQHERIAELFCVELKLRIS